MGLLDFKLLPLWVSIVTFVISAGIVWMAGTRIARYADQIATKTGIGHAAIGLVMLAGITSLPELAVSITGAVQGTPALAINNLLGSIAMQIAILAIADAVLGKKALTVVVGSPMILMQVAMNVLLLVFVAIAVSTGDRLFFHAGAWSWALLFLYGFSIWKLSNSQGRHLWIAKKSAQQKEDEQARNSEQEKDRVFESLQQLSIKAAAAGTAILIAGFLLSRTGDAIALKTGLGQSFVGAILIAFSTSLPEISSVVSAMRLKRYEMAISDIFGTNLFNVGLIFVVDVAYPGNAALNEVGKFSLVASLLGITLTSLYLIGLIERRDRTVARMGIDSLAVLVCYGGGVYLLYQLR